MKLSRKATYTSGVALALILTVIFLSFLVIIPADATGETEEYLFTILHTNDIHAALDGFPYLATAAEDIRAEKSETGEPVLLTDGGDFLGGHPFSWLNLRGLAPELSLIQMLDYDVLTIGNHEFDINDLALAQILKDAGYPDKEQRPVIFGSNIEPPQDHPLAEEGLLNKTYVQELDNGLTIGWFGVIGRGAMPPTIYKHGPVEFANPNQAAREAVDELQAKNVDLIIAVNHAGPNDNRRMAEEVPDINLILGGHSHSPMDPEYEGDTLIFQTADALKLLGVLELAYNPENGRLRLRNDESGRDYQLPLDDGSVDPHPLYLEEVENLRKEAGLVASEMTNGLISDIDETVAYSDFKLVHRGLEEIPLGNIFTDALRLITEEKTGQRVDFAWQSTGLFGIEIGPGELSLAELAAVPYLGTGQDMEPGNPVVSFYLTGKEIYNILEVSALLVDMTSDTDYFFQISGLRYRYDPNRAVLFHAPVIDMPIPSLHAVVGVEMYTGEGPQSADDVDYTDLRRSDETLYRVATESNVMVHVPEIGEELPWLAIVPKDEDGNPLDYIDEHGNVKESIIVYDEQGNEVKTWQALVEYAAMQEPGAYGLPQIPEYFADADQRIFTVWTVPLLVWPAIIIAGIITLIVVLIRRRRRHKLAV